MYAIKFEQNRKSIEKESFFWKRMEYDANKIYLKSNQFSI